jgi:predicted ArsR family transcriptional regulator
VPAAPLNPASLDVIDVPATAIAALDPVRASLLAAMGEPASATTLAAALGLPRQKVNYHLRTLEAHGLVRFVEERPRRGLVERLYVATASSYVVSPAALGDAGADPDTQPDKLSARYLIALAARVVREVGDLMGRADAAGKPLATLAIDTELKFASAADRAAFTAELAVAVQNLAARYHDESAPRGRWHRLVVGAHPIAPPRPSPPEEQP